MKNKIWYDSDGGVLDISNCSKVDCVCWRCQGWPEDPKCAGHPYPPGEDFIINQFAEFSRQKEKAIKNNDFDKAAEFRAKIYDLKSTYPFLYYIELGWHLSKGPDYQMRDGQIGIILRARNSNETN